MAENIFVAGPVGGRQRRLPVTAVAGSPGVVPDGDL
jgi:hypothetical protein